MSNSGCGCGPWPRSAATKHVCGTFQEPTRYDEGQCFPYRTKRDCEAPVVPVAPCNDETFEVIAQPGNVLYPFKISAGLFDQNCLPITDEGGNQILTYLV